MESGAQKPPFNTVLLRRPLEPGQYNSSTRALETNVRWRWEFEPGSDLFVVYTDGRDATGRGFSRLVSRGLAIKFTRFFRF